MCDVILNQSRGDEAGSNEEKIRQEIDAGGKGSLVTGGDTGTW